MTPLPTAGKSMGELQDPGGFIVKSIRSFWIIQSGKTGYFILLPKITTFGMDIMTLQYEKQINLLLGIGVVAMALSMSSSAFAQDIIRTKAGKDIAAKVLEISDEEVSYKLYDNQDGPTIRISTEKLYKIFFENGSEYAFVEEIFSHNLPADAPLQDLVADGNNVYIMMDDPTNSFSEKDKYIREYLREYTPWNVVDNLDDADFILYVEGPYDRALLACALGHSVHPPSRWDRGLEGKEAKSRPCHSERLSWSVRGGFPR
jgi:hypothetical protein